MNLVEGGDRPAPGKGGRKPGSHGQAVTRSREVRRTSSASATIL